MFEKDDSVVEDVYAGPDPDVPPTDPAEEDNDLPDAPGPMECVYAGPDMMGPPPEMMMCVYAGPDYFSGVTREPAGAPAPEETGRPAPERPRPDSGKYCLCLSCGTPLSENAKFCHECGAPVPRDD